MRRERESPIEVFDLQPPLDVDDSQFAVFQRRAKRSPQHRLQHAMFERLRDRVPVDVEELRPAGAFAILQHIEPVTVS